VKKHWYEVEGEKAGESGEERCACGSKEEKISVHRYRHSSIHAILLGILCIAKATKSNMHFGLSTTLRIL